MKVILFYPSLISDWNNGNAHFLRGIASELVRRGHHVSVYEPQNAWSVSNLVGDEGETALHGYQTAYPELSSNRYTDDNLSLEEALEGADIVIVHEWNDHDLVKRIGEHRKTSASFKLFFHDTHHRSVTDQESMRAYDLRNYDGVLAFGATIRDVYLEKGWAERAWAWHEAADTTVFHPIPNDLEKDDLVWIGNWGDDERAAELDEFLIRPAHDLALRATVYGVRYPDHARKRLDEAGIAYGGWLPNYKAPALYAQHRVTVHVPRRPYVSALPGIPTIRVFEALACGIPLISAPWADTERLFSPGEDFLVAQNGRQMRRHLRDILKDASLAQSLARKGRRTVLARHTCAHRVDELLEIVKSLNGIATVLAGAA